MMTKKSVLSYQWLSLIEVLIAILVFAVGILAVLQLIIKTMVTVDKVALQTQATMLASQWMEITHSIRNTNILKWLPRDCAEIANLQWWVLVDDCPKNFFEWNNVLRVAMQHGDLGDTNPYLLIDSMQDGGSFEANFWNFQLFSHKGVLQWNDTQLTWFDHDPTGEETNFARYVRLFPIASGIDWVQSGSEEYILGVESVVLIQKWSYTGQIVMESLLGKIFE